ncbi:MAG: hypothetical protein C0525_09475 [Flavobacterium sp.]|uniref:hypothetical protein n=1 Tax=Flavobacterium sp. TaxID=239 RepID=UPI0025B9F51A|nr:hypothetical protein [Flavobacterium sp.]MBA4134942.1 hypothetical protein [Flavobacterium sp.]
MNYTVQNLTQVADCDVLLSLAQKEKADLTFRKLSVERLTDRYAETSVEVATQLQGVIAELAAVDSYIAILPDGPIKDEAVDKKTRLEYKKFLLEGRVESYGVVALLEKQMDLGRVEQEIAEVDAFVAAVEARKAAL